MDIINSNRLRVSVRPFKRDYAERFRLWNFVSYQSRDHDQPRPEQNYAVHVLGIVAGMKWRPDGKRGQVGKAGSDA